MRGRDREHQEIATGSANTPRCSGWMHLQEGAGARGTGENLEQVKRTKRCQHTQVHTQVLGLRTPGG